MATPYASMSDARNFYAGSDASGVTLTVPMGVAADLVQYYAPVPTPEPADYAEKARNAELLVGSYLSETQGFLSGDSLSSVGSSSYTHDGTIFRIIRRTMGTYATAGRIRVLRAERA